MNIKQFLRDPFGTKRIAELEEVLRLYDKAIDSNTRTIDELQHEKGMLYLRVEQLQKDLTEADRQYVEVLEKLRRVPVNMAAEHTLRKAMHLLPERERREAEGVLKAKPLTDKPYPSRGPLPRLYNPL